MSIGFAGYTRLGWQEKSILWGVGKELDWRKPWFQGCERPEQGKPRERGNTQCGKQEHRSLSAENGTYIHRTSSMYFPSCSHLIRITLFCDAGESVQEACWGAGSVGDDEAASAWSHRASSLASRVLQQSRWRFVCAAGSASNSLFNVHVCLLCKQNEKGTNLSF